MVEISAPIIEMSSAPIVDTGLFGVYNIVMAAHFSPNSNGVLKVCFALHFNLVRAPLLDKIFIGIADISIEPNLHRPAAWDKKILGMIQVNAFSPHTLAEAAMTKPLKHNIWSVARESAKDAGYSMGLLDITNGENRQTSSVAITIDASTLDTVRQMRPWKIQCPVTGKVTKKPITLESSLEYLNLIRADTTNTMRLRVEMRANDIKNIQDAAAGADSLPAVAEASLVDEPQGLRVDGTGAMMLASGLLGSISFVHHMCRCAS
ncbi:hypothetical protein B0H17DRAFT_1208960 [Mycena rosella]|uniref:DUF8205 domain-containing protein n=1 Tax=Mycena rosella TaxID=1033263 RepID=A0AAD7G909_MYCRO|nr:hypothetical protein B0H17DRAFT_1208960 [Mycena rosella]